MAKRKRPKKRLQGATRKRKRKTIRLSRSGEREEIRPGLVKVTRYRDHSTGKFTKKPKRKTKKVTREDYQYRTKTLGEFVAGRLVSLEKTETKKIPTVDLDQWEGSVKNAMMASNIFNTVQYGGAQMVDIFLQGFDGKTRVTIKKSLDLSDINKKYMIGDMMVGKIIERLESLGYRTDYDIEKIKYWGKLATRKKDAMVKKPLRNVTMTFRVRY